MIPKLKKANSNLIVSVQVSLNAANARGLSKLETLKQCIASVMDVADGAGVWFGKSNLQTLKSFVECITPNIRSNASPIQLLFIFYLVCTIRRLLVRGEKYFINIFVTPDC
jgi:hypothetical protein